MNLLLTPSSEHIRFVKPSKDSLHLWLKNSSNYRMNSTFSKVVIPENKLKEIPTSLLYISKIHIVFKM